MTRGNDLAFRPGQPADRRRSWAPAAERSGHVRGLCPWCCRAGGSPVPLTGRRAAWPRGRGAWRWLLPVGRRGPSAAAPGARRPHRGHRRLAACPQTWPAAPPASGVARGRRPDASLPGPDTVPHPPLVRAPCPGRCPRPGSGRDAVPGPAPEDRPAPHFGPPGAGMIPARPSPALSPPWPGPGGAARASPELPAWPGGTGAGGLPVTLRAAVSHHRPSEPLAGFFRIIWCCRGFLGRSANDQVILKKSTGASKWIWSFDSGAGPILEATRAREMRTQITSWTPSMTRQPLQGLGAAIASAVSSAGRPGG